MHNNNNNMHGKIMKDLLLNESEPSLTYLIRITSYTQYPLKLQVFLEQYLYTKLYATPTSTFFELSLSNIFTLKI